MLYAYPSIIYSIQYTTATHKREDTARMCGMVWWWWGEESRAAAGKEFFCSHCGTFSLSAYYGALIIKGRRRRGTDELNSHERRK
jgi:hypothetical protein